MLVVQCCVTGCFTTITRASWASALSNLADRCVTQRVPTGCSDQQQLDWSNKKAQLSQRNRATLSVTECFAKSVQMTPCKSIISIPFKLCQHLIPFLRYSASKNGVTLKSGVRVVQGCWIWRRSIDYMRLTIVCRCEYRIALSCTVFELFGVEWCCDLEI